MALTCGTKLGPYEIVSPLGAGGMGEVSRARDRRLERTVAIQGSAPAVLQWLPVCRLFARNVVFRFQQAVSGSRVISTSRHLSGDLHMPEGSAALTGSVCVHLNPALS